jgi:hypothetical protein
MSEPSTQPTSQVPPSNYYASWDRPPAFQDPPKRRKVWPLVVGAVAAVLLIGGIAAYAIYTQIKTDPGIAACEAMAGGKPVIEGSGDGFTEAEYREARELFRGSKHEDISEAGVKMVDLLWQIEQTGGGNELGAALLYGGRAADATGAMTAACANHGIVVKFGD